MHAAECPTTIEPQTGGSRQPAETDQEQVAFAAWYFTGRFERLAVCLCCLVPALSVVVLLLLTRTPSVEDTTIAGESEFKRLVPAPVEDEANAAVLYNKAFMLRKPFIPPPNVDPAPPNPESLYSSPLEKLDQPWVRQWLAANAPALKTTQEATVRVPCNWGMKYEQGFGMLMPHLSRLRSMSQLLAVQARLYAKDGNHAAAAEALQTIFALADHTSSDPLIISDLVAIAIRNIGTSTLEAIVRDSTPTRVEECEMYRKSLPDDRQRLAKLQDSLTMEKLMGILTLQQLARTNP